MWTSGQGPSQCFGKLPNPSGRFHRHSLRAGLELTPVCPGLRPTGPSGCTLGSEKDESEEHTGAGSTLPGPVRSPMVAITDPFCSLGIILWRRDACKLACPLLPSPHVLPGPGPPSPSPELPWPTLFLRKGYQSWTGRIQRSRGGKGGAGGHTEASFFRG